MGNERRRGNASERYFQSRRATSKKKDSNILKKALLASGAVGAAALIAGGAYLVTRKDESGVSGEDFSDVSTFFPDMEEKKVLESGSFRGGGRNIDFYNFTKAKFNSVNASKIYDFVGSIQELDFLIDLQSNSGEKLNLKINRHQDKDINIFVVPYDAKLPHYVVGVDPLLRGGTGQDGSMVPATTIVRIYDEEGMSKIPTDAKVGLTPEEIANTTIYTEACQALFQVTVDGTPDIRFQEMFCNSLDLMYGVKRQGKTYEEYYKTVWSSTRLLGDTPLPMAPFSQSSFDSMPVLNVFE